MALINKDTRIARYSAEEGVGWVPLVPGLETSPSFESTWKKPATTSTTTATVMKTICFETHSWTLWAPCGTT